LVIYFSSHTAASTTLAASSAKRNHEKDAVIYAPERSEMDGMVSHELGDSVARQEIDSQARYEMPSGGLSKPRPDHSPVELL